MHHMMVKIANHAKRQLQLSRIPADMVVVLVENFLFPAINVTSIHVAGWVLPLCREI